MAGSDAHAGFGLEAGIGKLVGELLLRFCLKLSIEALGLGIVRVGVVDRLENVKKMDASAGLQKAGCRGQSRVRTYAEVGAD